MALPGIPYNFYLQSGNRQNYLSWDLSPGATSYSVQRSLDGVTYTTYATPVSNSYLDTVVTVGTLYYYQIASVNVSGTSPYTAPLTIVPTPTGEMSLGQIRLNAQQRADRVNSNFVTLPEWNAYIVQSMYELYDLLITTDKDLYITTPAQFTSNGTDYLYPLPDGITSFINGITSATGFIAEPFYKLMGVDLGVNTATNAWVTLSKFNFIDRNKYLYANSNSTIYGVFNSQYRLVGLNNIEIVPTPSGMNQYRLWYIPRLPQLLKDTDLTTISISGWIEYVIVDAAIKALQKQESDVSILMVQKMALIKRIEDTAVERDSGRPDTISDVRSGGLGNYGPNGYGNGPFGGF